MEKKVDVSVVFKKNLAAKTKIVVNQGSSRSGKTYSILQVMILVKAYEESNAVFTIVRKTLPSLKASAMRDFFEILKEHNMYDERKHNKSENTYLLNNNLFEFVSLDQPQKKRGTKRQYLFVNEANELTLEDWVQLIMRTEKQAFLDFNPSIDDEHWINTHVIPRADCTFIHSTYKDNEAFLPRAVVEEIENLKNVDPMYWRIYGLGLPGRIKGLVFEHWDLVDEMPNDQDCKWISFGMDYGFQNDPTALIKVVKCNGELWLDEMIYSRGLIATELARWMGELGLSWKDHVVGDRKPEMIYELKKLGYNVEGAYKPPGIIMTRIDILKRFKINITKRSVNLIKEFRNYKWKETQDGRTLNEPIDKFNHGIDALGYVITAREFQVRRKMRLSKVSL